MGGPLWLSSLLAAAMLGVTVFCTCRLGVSVVARRHRSAEWDVDVFHALMGLAMAGMLAGDLATFSDGAWLLAFSLGAAWFAWHLVRGLAGHARARCRIGHCLPHLMASGSMVYMLLAIPTWSGAAGLVCGRHAAVLTGSMTMGAASGMAVSEMHPIQLPVLAVLLVGFFLIEAAVLVDRAFLHRFRTLTLTATGTADLGAVAAGMSPSGPPAGQGARGSNRPSGPGAMRLMEMAPPRLPASAPAPSPAPAAAPLALRLGVACQVAMALTMAYMLVTML